MNLSSIKNTLIAVTTPHKSFTIRFYRMLIIFGVFILVTCWNFFDEARHSMQSGIFLNVSATGALASYKDHQFANGNFISGMDGQLLWKPRTLKESMILLTVADQSTDPLDIAAMLIIIGILFYTIRQSRDEAVFTKNVRYGFLLLIFFITISVSVRASIRRQLGEYILSMTHGALSAKYHPTHDWHDPMLLALFLALLMFPDKALEIQKEQDLTI